jgi:tRNA threonylcarbamoyladenosine biosynthesis protein TsaB
MRILAIETTGRHGSLALLDGNDHRTSLVSEVRLDIGRTAQILAPSLATLLADAGWPASSVELVAVASGPGSFTGLRIGVTTAKAFAYAVGAQILPVDTLEVLAAQAPPANAKLWAIMDAQRQELFVATFGLRDGVKTRESATAIVGETSWIASLQTGERVTGPPLNRLRDLLPHGVIALPDSFWQPTATVVGEVAWKHFVAGQRSDVWQLTPNYFRLSAAEEKRNTSGLAHGN